LTPEERALLVKARFAVAACRLEQENMTPEALRLYKILAADYADRLDGLLACEKAWTCACRLEQMEEGRAALRKAWEILYRLPESAFRQPARSRDQWRKWIEERIPYLKSATAPKTPASTDR
jgi:hypothetical protein